MCKIKNPRPSLPPSGRATDGHRPYRGGDPGNNNSKKVELAGSTHTRKLATQKLLLSAFSVSSNRTVFRADPNIALGSPHKWLSRHIAAASITTSTLRSNLFVVVLFFLSPDSAKHDFQRRVAERAVVVSLN